jgi:hypothetical protein
MPSNDPNRQKNPELLALHELVQHVDPILENQMASQCEKEKPCIPTPIQKYYCKYSKKHHS